MSNNLSKKELQKEKLAEALRENLKRRKNQQRLREAIEQDTKSKGDDHANPE